LREETKETKNTGKETLDQEMSDDQTEAAADGDGKVVL
jgi:hypothetical protein